jgi:hypothetical protein
VEKTVSVSVRLRRAGINILATAGLMTFASAASATSIAYQIGSGAASGFEFSHLMSEEGEVFGTLSGELVLDHDVVAGTFSFVSSSVTLDSEYYDFAITGGSFDDVGRGRLDFSLVALTQSAPGGFGQVNELRFRGGDPRCCGTDGPNWVTPEGLRLLGYSSPGEGERTIAMALGGSASAAGSGGIAAVPEPASGLVFAIGVLVLGRPGRRAGRLAAQSWM